MLRTWRAVAVGLVGVALVASLGIALFDAREQRQATTRLLEELEGLDDDQLETEKLRREVVASEFTRRQGVSLGGRLVGAAPFLTVLLAALGALVTLWKYIDETTQQRERDRQQAANELEERKRQAAAAERQRQLDLEERQRAREQAAIESQRRFDEKFAVTLTNLGADSEAVRAGAAVMLDQFLHPRYDDYFDAVFSVLVANVRLRHPDAVRDLLATALVDALRRKLEREGEDALEGFDLARARLPRAWLADLRLRGVDIAYADLKSADLTGCDLRGARGYQTVLSKAQLSRADLTEARLQKVIAEDAFFHDARLVSADLREATLAGADFSRARLQSAHLEEADLRRARFAEADLADTFLTEVTLDDTAIRSMSRARRWRDAHLDADVRERLDRASQEG